ncbi:MAG: dolichyl-phosphate beta-D-mannosyltransferase [Candidatus Yanofskybacteria bacterium CG10_big_fil_rev_8_21_14_0_10_37_15]|uniref:Dolichyl-phosphate beta-D-mannosyltransferase n=1 Tax=Candidatus Yanofskybacteria bacterium CG10_big_fil_rev_8_21_14_0_10_37_15 TaxID=1975097 RepID=A0A2H0R5S4_9BACT|nr:MAG: dolichyl-phosphate beta-D-mannosyltransferase [Candidatus Yanofskybacteria bacterium CG10_big_fil_rev_8_21_14_0_10_37_15]
MKKNEDKKYSRLIKLIPTYNEKENIAVLIRTIFDTLPEASLLVIDDNSPDGTADLVSGMKKDFPNLDVYKRVKDKGFGKSYIDGFKKILNDERYDYVVMMDADFSHDPAVVSAMADKLSDCDVVIGSRYVDGGGIKNWNIKRRLLSRFANFYAGIILSVPIKDLTTGFMCFKKEVLKNIDLDSLKSEGYAFLIELKFKMFKAGYEIVEYPITFTERREGQSKMSSKIIWEAVKLPWRLKLNSEV